MTGLWRRSARVASISGREVRWILSRIRKREIKHFLHTSKQILWFNPKKDWIYLQVLRAGECFKPNPSQRNGDVGTCYLNETKPFAVKIAFFTQRS